jgi:hypothetical protein
MIIKAQMVFLGSKSRVYNDKNTGAEKKSTNVKMMDYESELYDFFVNENNHNLLKNLEGIPPMTPVNVDLEVGAYQLKPFVRLQAVKVGK